MKKDGIIYEKIKSAKFGLIVSLPANSAELAKAAEAGGADMLKVHLNVLHAASGNSFGSFAEERDKISAVIQSVKIPVGVMPGAGTTASFEDMLALEEMGIAFYDIYTTDMPVSYGKLKNMEGMPALGANWNKNEPKYLKKAGYKLLEASIVHHDRYGSPLVLSDLLNYSFIAEKFEGAVITPTQKAIRPSETASLAEIGVSAVMIGKIVTGETASEIESATALFRKAIEKI